MIQFNIEVSSGIPIYKQVFEQVERMIVNGYLVAGTFLPSVRQVASSLDVNPMTISKAYGLLEERGYLTRQRGKGMMVAHQSEQNSKKEKMMILEKAITELVSDAVQMGINKQELLALITEKVEKHNLSDQAEQQG
ncbi:GntR family transcriptional regulator [Colwelliaceae bacterium 6441]